jgi:hypothetical protein
MFRLLGNEGSFLAYRHNVERPAPINRAASEGLRNGESFI